MFPFTNVSSLSTLYNYDRTDDFIESGQFGTVYRAIATQDRPNATRGTAVAVKELTKNKINNEKEMCDIINEVEALKRLKHRNCISFIEALQTNAHIYIVMELIDNAKDLFAAMRESRTSEAREAWSRQVAKQLLEALTYLHRDLKIVHRDVKPENILLTTDDQGLRVVLIDFGLAKYLGTSSRPHFTPAMLRQRSVEALNSVMKTSQSLESLDMDIRSNSPMLSTPCGTLKYLAPETVRGMAENGAAPRTTTRGDLPQSDMYAVGIILFAMLSTSPPFAGTTKGDLIRQMDAGPNFETNGWKGISMEARDLVAGLLNPIPSARLDGKQALRHPWIMGTKMASSSTVLTDSVSASSASEVDRGQLNNLIECASEDRMPALKGPPSTNALNSSSKPPIASSNKYFAFIGQSEVPMDQS